MIVEPKGRLVQISEPSTGLEELQVLGESLESGWLTQGPKVRAFEKAFALRHSVTHALATTSCTTALHLALLTLGIGSGDEVIVPAFTWVATANVVIYCGAKPVFVDVDERTYNLDVNKVLRAITKRTKAVIPVHLFGLCADVDALRDVVPANVVLIEDAACATGAAYKGLPAGSLGDIGCFSFHPRKTITTGEGGMLTTSNDTLAERANILRNHGASISEEERHRGSQPYLLPEFNVLGFNYRMTDLQGAIGLVQIGKLDRFITERHKWASWYTKVLADISWIRTPYVPDGYTHAWQAFVAVIDQDHSPISRNEVMDHLAKVGISSRPGTHAVTDLGYYKNLLQLGEAEGFTIASYLEQCSIALPLHNRMTEEDYAYISDTLHRI